MMNYIRRGNIHGVWGMQSNASEWVAGVLTFPLWVVALVIRVLYRCLVGVLRFIVAVVAGMCYMVHDIVTGK
jgi:hypothetical protein